MLDLRTFQKTIDRLSENLSLLEEYENKLKDTQDDKKLIETLKEAVIKNFEMCSEQSRKFVDRVLKEQNFFVEKKQDIFTRAQEIGLIDNAEKWEKYNSDRNTLTHTYDPKIVNQAIEVAKKLLIDAKKLILQMRLSIKIHVPKEILVKIKQIILSSSLSKDIEEIWVFGSRITNYCRIDSDLDLALLTSKPLNFDDFTTLQMAFEKEDLPFKVDIVDFNALEQNFQEIIKTNYTYLPE